MDDPVRQQNEQWIYPETVSDLSRDRTIDGGDPGIRSFSYWPDRKPSENLHILVAGCGSNAAARMAFRHREASVVGIDISSASLAHAESLKSKHNLENLELHQCRVEDVGSLGRTFDFVDCTGVLHHLPDPPTGLKALTKVLSPDGVVFLMLYGKYGRAGLYMAQELFRVLGLGQSRDDVVLVRKALDAFKADHQVRPLLNQADDRRYDAGIVDMFLHRLDRPYTVDECLELLKSAGLSFQGWMERFFYYPEGQVPEDNPLFARLLSLPEDLLWRAMELINGGIAHHMLFACRQDRDRSTYVIDFSDDRVMDMVPVRERGLTVRELGPRGTELVRPPFPSANIQGTRGATVRAINGQRTLRECLKTAGLEADETQRLFFRKLWRLGYFGLVHKSAT